jgi:hypothetical protein
MCGEPAQPCGTRRLGPVRHRRYVDWPPDYAHRQLLVAGQPRAIPVLVDRVLLGLRR